MNYLERLNTIPPPLCRIVAVERYSGKLQRPKRPYRLLTMREIAQKGGLPWQRAAAIARMENFNRVPVEDAEKFRLGCGIKPENEWYIMQFVKRLLSDINQLEELLETAPRGSLRALRKMLERL